MCNAWATGEAATNQDSAKSQHAQHGYLCACSQPALHSAVGTLRKRLCVPSNRPVNRVSKVPYMSLTLS